MITDRTKYDDNDSIGEDELSSIGDSYDVESIKDDASTDDLKENVIERAVMAFEARRIHKTIVDAASEGVVIKKAEVIKASDNEETSWQNYLNGYFILMKQLFPNHIDHPRIIQEAKSILDDYKAIQDVIGFERYASSILEKKILDAAIEACLEESHSTSSSVSLPLEKKEIGFFSIRPDSFDCLKSETNTPTHK